MYITRIMHTLGVVLSRSYHVKVFTVLTLLVKDMYRYFEGYFSGCFLPCAGFWRAPGGRGLIFFAGRLVGLAPRHHFQLSNLPHYINRIPFHGVCSPLCQGLQFRPSAPLLEISWGVGLHNVKARHAPREERKTRERRPRRSRLPHREGRR